MADFKYQPLFELGSDDTEYRKLTSDFVSTDTFDGHEILKVDPKALEVLAEQALDDVTHLLRTSHLKQLRKILDDPEASSNDRFVALELLKNANIAAGRVLPGCQDTGTAIVHGHKGQFCLYRWTRRRVARQGHLPGLRHAQSSLLPDGTARHVHGEEHRDQPAGPDRDPRGGRL